MKLPKNTQIIHLESFYSTQIGCHFFVEFKEKNTNEWKSIKLHSGVLINFKQSRSELLCMLVEKGENKYKMKDEIIKLKLFQRF